MKWNEWKKIILYTFDNLEEDKQTDQEIMIEFL